MSRRTNQDDFSVGQDSFLDTTANLVGILIILVVVIGAKTQIDAVNYGKEQAAESDATNLTVVANATSALITALEKQQHELSSYEQETAYRKLERDMLLGQVAQARSDIEEQLADADLKKRESIEKQQALDELEHQLQETKTEIADASTESRPKILLEHLPTPMAKTVFTRELHIQMKNGRVTIIPWDRLVSMLHQQVPLAVRRTSARSTIADSLGPVGGFVMHYRMVKVTGGFELDHFELEATPSSISESLDEALSNSSRLRIELDSRDPAETVVTAWVYPDSFAQFRRLKAALFDLGFLSAARPLPPDVRIGASPRGTRSSAQ